MKYTNANDGSLDALYTGLLKNSIIEKRKSLIAIHGLAWRKHDYPLSNEEIEAIKVQAKIDYKVRTKDLVNKVVDM